MPDLEIGITTEIDLAEASSLARASWRRKVDAIGASGATNISDGLDMAFRAIGEALGLPREIWQDDAEALCDLLLEGSRERLGAAVLGPRRRDVPVQRDVLDH